MIARVRRRFAETLAWWREAQPRGSAVAVRGVVGVCAVACVALVPGGFLDGLAAVAALLALIMPARVGAGPFVVLCVLAWAFGFARAETVPVLRTVAFAVLLYAAHHTVALAAATPIDTRLTLPVVVHWVRAALPSMLSVPVTAAVVTLIGRPGGAVVWDVVGIAGGVLVLAGLLRAVGSGQAPRTRSR